MSIPPSLEALNDPCTCGHVRGEHFTPQGGPTAYCLMDDCPCPRFKDATAQKTETED
jgi:hypothetical protein